MPSPKTRKSSTPTKQQQPRSPGELVDAGCAIEKEIQGLNRQIKALEISQEAITSELKLFMSNNGVDKVDSKLGTFTKKETTIKIIDNYEALTDYIKQKGFFEIFQKRLSGSVVSDLETKHGAIPGIKDHDVVSYKFKPVK